MRACPFCGFNEGWIKNFEDGFRVECKKCGSVGPKSQTDSGAEEKWNGFLQTKDPMDQEEWHRALKEELVDENMGGVSAPMATLTNTPGMGNAVPASIGAMTGSQQSSSSAIGSGDNWGKSLGPYTQAGKPKKKKAKKKKRVYKKTKKLSEQNISPFDKIGIMMAKKMKVPLYFEKGKDQSVKHVKQKQVDKVPHKYKHKIYPYSDYENLVKEKKKSL